MTASSRCRRRKNPPEFTAARIQLFPGGGFIVGSGAVHREGHSLSPLGRGQPRGSVRAFVRRFHSFSTTSHAPVLSYPSLFPPRPFRRSSPRRARARRRLPRRRRRAARAGHPAMEQRRRRGMDRLRLVRHDHQAAGGRQLRHGQLHLPGQHHQRHRRPRGDDDQQHDQRQLHHVRGRLQRHQHHHGRQQPDREQRPPARPHRHHLGDQRSGQQRHRHFQHFHEQHLRPLPRPQQHRHGHRG